MKLSHAIIGLGVVATVLTLLPSKRESKVNLNALKNAPKPRVQLNAFGYYAPIDERHTAWLNVHGNPGAQALWMGGNKHLIATLPPDASPVCRDQYSKEFHNIPTEQGTPIQTDEYGRSACGIGANPINGLLGVAQLALPYIPGVGTAAAAGLGFAVAIGQGKSLRDAGLAAGYYAVPAHLRWAYSAGVAIASGESIDQAALTAAEHEYPGARAVYEQGKAMAS